MSAVAIRAALETGLNGMSPALGSAWENTTYTPVTGTPYQEVALLLATPDNTEFGPNYLEQGFMQVTLCYPLGTGAAAATARAQLLRTTFKRGNAFVSGGVTVKCLKTPQILPGQPEGDRYRLPVRIPFLANVTA
jgi:hypothetical protein